MKKFMIALSIILCTYLIFSMRVNEKPIFTHLFQKTSPLTDAIQSGSSSIFKEASHKGEEYSRMIFTNSAPKVQDQVKSTLSSAKKHQKIQEHIEEKDREELDDLIKEF